MAHLAFTAARSPACYEGKEERAVHLTKIRDSWHCTVCKNFFYEEDNSPAFGMIPVRRG